MKLDQNIFLKNFHKFITNNSFRIVVANDPHSLQYIKTTINRVLSIKGIVVVVHVTLVKPNVMQKLDRMNIIIQLKVQNDRNTFKATSTIALHGLSFQMFKKVLGPGRT